MNSHSLELNFDNHIIPIQILELNKAFFIYIGSSLQQINFENLTLSFYNQKKDNLNDEGTAFSSVIYDDLYSELAKQIGERFSKIFKCPFYISMNIPDDQVNTNLEFRFILENSIKNYLKEIIKIDF